MRLLPLTGLIILIGCNKISSDYNSFSHKHNLHQLIDSYIFLSETHDLLHIMMGEHEGSPIDSYMQYCNKINIIKNNYYIEPILLALDNIKISDNNFLINADKFDALVDYYQMGIQMMIEGILKGHGYDPLPKNSKDYENIKMVEFYKN